METRKMYQHRHLTMQLPSTPTTIPPTIEKEKKNKQKTDFKSRNVVLLCDRVTPLWRDLSNYLINHALPNWWD
jgi:hypothetical protein